MSVEAKLKNLTLGAIGGAVWVSGGNLSSMGLRILFLAFLARLLHPEDFGLAAIGTSFSAITLLITDSGLSNTLVQRTHVTPRHESAAFSYSMLIGVAMTAGTWLAAPWLERFFAMPGLAPVISVIGISFALQGVCVVPRAMLKRAMEFRTLALIDFFSFNAGYGLVACLLAWNGFGVWSLAIGTVIYNAIAAILYYARAPVAPAIHVHSLRELLATSSGFSLSAVANLIALQGDNLIVGRFAGGQALGFYSRAYQLMTIPAGAFGQITNYVIFPMLSRIQDDRTRLRRAFVRATAIVALCGLPASVMICLYAPEIVHILFGPRWEPIIPLLAIMGAGTYFRLGYKIPGLFLQASGHVRADAAIQFIYAVCVVGGTLIAVRQGLDAVAMVIVGSVCTTYALATLTAMRLLQIPFSLVARALASAVVLTAILGMMNWWAIHQVRPYGSPFLTASAGLAASALLLLVCFFVQPIRRRILRFGFERPDAEVSLSTAPAVSSEGKGLRPGSMKVMYAHPVTFPGTAANTVQVLKVCAALARRTNVDVTLAIAGGLRAENADAIFTHYGVERTFTISRLPFPPLPGREIFFGICVAILAWARRADFVFTRSVTIASVTTAMRVQTVLELHQSIDDSRALVRRRFEQLVSSPHMALLIFITERLRAHVQSSAPQIAGKSLSMPLGGDVCEPATPRSFPGFSVGYVGQLYPGKGMEIIVPLARMCRWADFHVVGGDPIDIAYWREQAQGAQNLIFHGYVPHGETAGYIAGFDAVLCPYQRVVQGSGRDNVNLADWMSPLKAFEYMALGKAIVASDLPVLHEIFENGRDAILCPPDAVAEWAEALKKLRDDPVFRGGLGSNAREKLQSRFTRDAWAQKVISKLAVSQG